MSMPVHSEHAANEQPDSSSETMTRFCSYRRDSWGGPRVVPDNKPRESRVALPVRRVSVFKSNLQRQSSPRKLETQLTRTFLFDFVVDKIVSSPATAHPRAALFLVGHRERRITGDLRDDERSVKTRTMKTLEHRSDSAMGRQLDGDSTRLRVHSLPKSLAKKLGEAVDNVHASKQLLLQTMTRNRLCRRHRRKQMHSSHNCSGPSTSSNGATPAQSSTSRIRDTTNTKRRRRMRTDARCNNRTNSGNFVARYIVSMISSAILLAKGGSQALLSAWPATAAVPSLLLPVSFCRAFVSEGVVVSSYLGGEYSPSFGGNKGPVSRTTTISTIHRSRTAASTRGSTSTQRAARERSPPEEGANRNNRNNPHNSNNPKNWNNDFGPFANRNGGFGRNSNSRLPGSRRRGGGGTGGGSSNSTVAYEQQASQYGSDGQPSAREIEMQKRLTQLESLVASQAIEIKRLKDEVRSLNKAAESFARVVDLLRQAGLQTDDEDDVDGDGMSSLRNSNKDGKSSNKKKTEEDDGNMSNGSSRSPWRSGDDPVAKRGGPAAGTGPSFTSADESMIFDGSEIFGTAPSSVIEAADVAGASILAGLLGGKRRMLVDVRDAELSTSVRTLVEFIELAVLPVAAGLEGLKATRNRLKIVFPTVGHLLQYRRTMALAAPEVVALSTLGFEPVEPHDKLVVIIAPSPDDAEGLAAMNELLTRSDGNAIEQPVVVFNHHMVPLSGPAADFEVAYHLRLLTVQYVSGSSIPNDIQQQLLQEEEKQQSSDGDTNTTASGSSNDQLRDNAVEAAVQHAQKYGLHHGLTRAMVIRAYPKPWHVFVDTSPDDMDTDFEVAATFDTVPSLEEVNKAIVECLEGSEQEEELVAQQMQQALENGQLDRVNDILGGIGLDIFDDEDDDDLDDDDWDLFREDSV